MPSQSCQAYKAVRRQKVLFCISLITCYALQLSQISQSFETISVVVGFGWLRTHALACTHTHVD